MKLLINTAIIEKMQPCADRFANWVNSYGNEEHDLASFFALDNIMHSDKLWVALRLLPRFEVEVFAIECAVSCAEYDNAAAAYAAAAAYRAADAAYAVYAAYRAANATANVTTYAAATYATYADAADAAYRAADATYTTYADAAYYASESAYYASESADDAAREQVRKEQLETLLYLAEGVA